MRRRARRWLVGGGAAIILACLLPTLPLRVREPLCANRPFEPGVPIDPSLTEIFDVPAFVSEREWSLVRDGVHSGRPVRIPPSGGRPEEAAVWLERGPDPRHSPMLIKALAPRFTADGTAVQRRGVWLIDYCADGTVDRAVDWGDDGAPPRMTAVYYPSFAYRLPGLLVTDRAIGLTDYQYVQDADQWNSRFTGAGFLAMFYYNPAHRSLVPLNEAPFCFYDLRGDGLSAAALRVELPLRHSWVRGRFLLAAYLSQRFAPRETISTMRYSLDVDAEARPEAPYSYDVSITGVGWAPPAGGARLSGLRLRNVTTEPMLGCDEARRTLEHARWQRLALTWVEDDMNVAENDRERHRRWEGVINRGSAEFPQVGGPPSRAFNTRTEIAEAPTPPVRLYYSGIDHRLHLLGARTGRLAIDYDGDGRRDMEIRYSDTDGDGMFDTWEIDADGDGTVDRVYRAANQQAIVLDLEYAALRDFYVRARARSIDEYRRLIEAIRTRVHPGEELRVERAHRAERRRRASTGPPASLEMERFYLAAAAELWVRALAQRLPACAERVRPLFESGRFADAATALERSPCPAPRAGTPPPERR